MRTVPSADLKIFAHRARIFSDQIEILMAYRSQERVMAAQPITYVATPEGLEIPPTLILHRDQAQNLMDELWNCGLRPTEGTGSAGALAATQLHLKDLRAIVGKKIGVELK